MIIGMSGFVVSDTIMKQITQELPLFQVIFLRHILMTIGLGVIACRSAVPVHLPQGRDRGLIALRILGDIGVTFAFLSALSLLSLGTATAIVQVQPLAVTLAAAVILKQPIGPRRLIAIMIGFGGVLLIVRPGSDAFGAPALLALLAVAFVVLRDLSTRLISSKMSTAFVAALTSAGIMAAAGAMSLTAPWQMLNAGQAGLIIGSACLVMVGYLGVVAAMRIGDIAVISPVRYVSLVIALILGFVFFQEVPGPLTLVGAAIVVATGLFTFFRESRSGGTPPLPPQTDRV
ncbi:hypothetical protein BFP70_18395 [Thioclava sp. SK-1]|nr:hypothetical protein BFP70_18395 [Thioclava sp. SK-1]